MSPAHDPNTVLRTERVLTASTRDVFAAFEQPDQLALWWGPNGFRNTFEQFKFTPGGEWIYVMHGPNGAHYANASVFRDIVPDTKIVIDHTSLPHFRLTVILTPRGDTTHLSWAQQFETPEIATQLRPICNPANEQNLDRLEALLAVPKS